MHSITTYARTALALLLGERCVVCGRPQAGSTLCPRCLLQLPYINIKGVEGNAIERLFWGVTPVVRASAMLAYRPGYDVERLIHSIKYSGHRRLAVEMGRWMAQELAATDFFSGIDYVQPVPLHRNRMATRGYNQSERLARGIADATGLPIGSFAKRRVDNVSQTRLSHDERRQNVEDIFAPIMSNIERHRPRHILIVDDVITTGSTAISCAQSIASAFACTDGGEPPVRFSFLALAYAGALHAGRLSTAELRRPVLEESAEAFRERLFSPLA